MDQAEPQFGVDVDSGDVVTLWIRGELSLSTAGQLRAALMAYMDDARDLVLDLHDVPFVDSSALGVMVGAQKRLRASGRSIVLRDPTAAVTRVLGMTGLTRIFQIEGLAPSV